jgi:hypothetical protein
VSLVAVFMALATGILVGSSLLNQSLIDSQRSTIASFAAEKDSLRKDLAGAQGDVNYRDNYLASLHSTLLTGRLIGHRVVLVIAPGAARRDVDALAKTFTEAGAQLVGRVHISDDFFATASADDPAATNKAALREAAIKRLGLPDVKSKAPEAQLAGALLTKEASRSLEPAADALLTELDSEGLISRDQVTDRGDLAVLICGTPPDKPTPVDDRTTAGLVKVAAALDAAGGGAVVAGPSDGAADGLLAAVRRDGAVSALVSTVDGVESPFGQVAAAYALVEQIAGGAGQYGAADSGDAALPQFRAPAAKK